MKTWPMNKWLRFFVMISAVVGFVWVMMWAVGQNTQKSLIKINQQIETLNSLGPEKYYNKEKQELLKKKEIVESGVKSFEKGTTNFIYEATLALPETTVAIVKYLLRDKEKPLN